MGDIGDTSCIKDKKFKKESNSIVATSYTKQPQGASNVMGGGGAYSNKWNATYI